MPNGPRLIEKPKGIIGSFLVTVTEPDAGTIKLPCVLSCWFNQYVYYDPLGGGSATKLKTWHQAMANYERVVLAQVDDEAAKASHNQILKREGYVGIFEISDLVISDPELRFVRAKFPIFRFKKAS